jgi:AcrR family transcriptional regulator
MTQCNSDDGPKPGLRERKKARTRVAIQQQALRLFRKRGYAETTVEQIAEAADVSTATVYRYFPTKPDLVIYDDLDEPMLAAIRAQPAELNAVEALRAAIGGAFGATIGQSLELQRLRSDLLRSEPELRAAMLDELTRTLREITGVIGQRCGRPADDDEVLALAGAVIGVTIAAWLGAEGDDWVDRFLERVEKGIRLLETGFDL